MLMFPAAFKIDPRSCARRQSVLFAMSPPTRVASDAADPRTKAKALTQDQARTYDDGTWGASEGFPVWTALSDIGECRDAIQVLKAGPCRGGLQSCTRFRVANYSGGFEAVLPCNKLTADPSRSTQLEPVGDDDPLQYTFGGAQRTPAAYLDTWPATGLLLLGKGGEVHCEEYRFGRSAEMRLTSWSMAKSVTSLLLGICLDRGLIRSLDDPAEAYAPELKGTYHGSVTIRNLANMCSGADVVHCRDNPTIYPCAFWGGGAEVGRTVAGWNSQREAQGTQFNYTELSALAVGMVIRAATGQTMAAFAQEALWRPLGAEADASFCTDTAGAEFNATNFQARLRDWGRLGLLVAHRGKALDGTRVVSETYIHEVTSWGAHDGQVGFGAQSPLPPERGGGHYPCMKAGGLNDLSTRGYKLFFWHLRPDGSLPCFNGAYGQRVLVDLRTGAVAVQTSVMETPAAEWMPELLAMLEATGERGGAKV
jgi:CubicO group peptidase (beta-lactamase class C family)